MGIDIYARWKNQTKREEDLQITGFSIAHGHVGYLREAYHGEPYATEYLVREAFEAAGGKAYIHASLLRERLPHAIELAKRREREVYGRDNALPDSEPTIRSFVDFVELCEEKERETGEPVLIIASR